MLKTEIVRQIIANDYNVEIEHVIVEFQGCSNYGHPMQYRYNVAINGKDDPINLSITIQRQ